MRCLPFALVLMPLMSALMDGLPSWDGQGKAAFSIRRPAVQRPVSASAARSGRMVLEARRSSLKISLDTPDRIVARDTGRRSASCRRRSARPVTRHQFF